MNQTAKTLLILGLTALISLILLIGLGQTLLPLMIAFALAYLTFPMIKTLERYHIRRSYALGGVFGLSCFICVLVLLLVIPRLIEDMTQFFNQLPITAGIAFDKVKSFLLSYGYQVEISKESMKAFISTHSNSFSPDFLKSTTALVGRFFSNFLSTIIMLLNMALIPLFYFHMVSHYESISHDLKELWPIPWRKKLSIYVAFGNEVLAGYLRGQCFVALILAALYAIGFSIIGLQFGFLLGLGTGLLSFIPYVGSIVGFLASMTIALATYQGIGPLISVCVVFLIVQGLEGTIITPKLVGNRVGLGVLSTMLALIVGGNLFGIVGMIGAIPVAAILRRILRDLKEEYQASSFYKG